MGKNQHVVPNGDKWSVKGENNSRMTKDFDTQKEASSFAREICINQKSELLIHNRQGRIRQKNSYGNDPFPHKG